MNWKDILERASWTALQAGLAAIPVAQLTAAFTEGVDITTIQQLALVGLGAAVGAFVSFIKTVAQERLGVLETRSNMIQAGEPPMGEGF
jgi:hypothetical protein